MKGVRVTGGYAMLGGNTMSTMPIQVALIKWGYPVGVVICMVDDIVPFTIKVCHAGIGEKHVKSVMGFVEEGV